MKCCNGKEHTREEWCGHLNLDSNELSELVRLLKKVKASCCIPHSCAHVSGAECPSCAAEDMLRTREWWQAMPI